MARIRTVKPAFWSSEQVMNLSRDARLLFIGIWNFADDAGRAKWSARTIKAQVLPGDDDVTARDVEAWMMEMQTQGLLTAYSVNGQRLFSVSGWHHQKINRPQPSKFPEPPSSPNPPEPITGDSVNPPGSITDGRERRGEEGKGRERRGDHAGEVRPLGPRLAPLWSVLEAEGYPFDEETFARSPRDTDHWRTCAAWTDGLRQRPDVPDDRALLGLLRQAVTSHVGKHKGFVLRFFAPDLAELTPPVPPNLRPFKASTPPTH